MRMPLANVFEPSQGDDSVDIAGIDPAIEFANMGSRNRVLCRTVTAKVGSETITTTRLQGAPLRRAKF